MARRLVVVPRGTLSAAATLAAPAMGSACPTTVVRVDFEKGRFPFFGEC